MQSDNQAILLYAVLTLLYTFDLVDSVKRINEYKKAIVRKNQIRSFKKPKVQNVRKTKVQTSEKNQKVQIRKTKKPKIQKSEKNQEPCPSPIIRRTEKPKSSTCTQVNPVS